MEWNVLILAILSSGILEEYVGGRALISAASGVFPFAMEGGEIMRNTLYCKKLRGHQLAYMSHSK